jgi:hypothetical protein
MSQLGTSTAPLLRQSSVARKKPPTAQIRMALDVIELAWKCAPHHGYRGGGAAGDYLSDLLRPILLADEESRKSGSPKPKDSPKR